MHEKKTTKEVCHVIFTALKLAFTSFILIVTENRSLTVLT